MSLRIKEDKIQVKSNLKLVARERGKIVRKVEGHNIWVNIGREFLASIICYSGYIGDVGTPERNDRIRWMGLGIGGNRQTALGVANSSPLGGGIAPNHYAGNNTFSDTDATKSYLERPVRVSWAGGGAPTAPPYDPVGDLWFGQVAPVSGLSGHPTATETRFTRLFTELELNGPTNYYPAIPLSEIGLFTDAVDRHRPSSASNPTNVYVAYDTFDTITKTVAITFEVDWTIKF